MKSRAGNEMHVTKAEKPVFRDIIPFASEGVEMEVISTDPSTGGFSCIFRGKAGATFAPHLHLAGADYLILSGALNYRDQLAPAGDSGYEPYGSLHEMTIFPEDTEMLFITHGPIMFIDEEKRPTQVMDSRWIEEQIAAGRTRAASAA
ncbi:cupin domain-containing protein [Sphingobium fuliginis]|jgi:hypothetical protein|uniref:Cupin domain-containing protein n=1 Tax=Sphingobium fuliginis (strain ATCC 27551) TaxID=336203 RepID=A0A7M2GQA6_SPHSA|nr:MULTISPECIES: cupin domain-containing protein [Sphingobium]QOT74129.1 cupin domain-containing protein [Sphingobium fuliginis]